MEERSAGIVLRTRPLTETSLIAHVLTPDLGRIAFVAKGAYRPKSAFAGKLDLLFEIEFSFVRSRRSELHNLREIKLLRNHANLRQELSRLNLAAYAVLLIEKLTETETPLPEYHLLLQQVLEVLDSLVPSSALVYAIELKILQSHGTSPSPDRLSNDARKLIDALARLPLRAAEELPFDRALTQEIDLFLRRGIELTLGRIPPLRARLVDAPLERLP